MAKLANVSLSTNEKISLVSNLATMLTAGIPILEAVDSLLEGAKGNQKKILTALRSDLMQGKRIYTTFEKFPRVFNKVTVNIIKAAEEAGSLDTTLKDLVTSIKKDQEFNDRIKSAMIYPMFIMVVFVGTMLMILIVVVPKIATVFTRLNVPLPLPTKIMIFLSNLILENTLLVVIGTGVFIAIIIFVLKRYKSVVINLFVLLPLISKLAREIDLTRFTRGMFMLLTAGIPITTALELTSEVVTKKEVAKAINHTKQGVLAGKKFSEGLKDGKAVFPYIMIKITEAGEKSGSLDKAMQDTSEYLDYQVSNTLKTVTSLVEPLMLVLVGGMIGGMMLAIIAPIYGLVGQVGGR